MARLKLLKFSKNLDLNDFFLKIRTFLEAQDLFSRHSFVHFDILAMHLGTN